MDEAEVAMTRSIRVAIPGPPFAWQRARAGKVRGHVRFFESAEQRSWKAYAGAMMLAARQAAGIQPFATPVRVRIVARFECPQGEQRKRDPAPERWHVGRRDADNIAKAIGDAGNGVLWLDDRQVVEIYVAKRTAAQGAAPETVVEVEEVER